MVFPVFLWILIYFNALLVQNVCAVTVRLNITYDPSNSNQISCNPSSSIVKASLSEHITVKLIAKQLTLINSKCSLEKDEQNAVLKNQDFKNESDQLAMSARTIATKAVEGKWKCTFAFTTTTPVTCNFNVTIVEDATKNPMNPNAAEDSTVSKQYYYIGGGVGGLVIILIIIAQAIIIIRYKNKIKSQGVSRRLSQKPPTRDDPTRYSTMPGERKKSKRAKQREDSGIYQSLENLHIRAPVPKSPIAERPPMPLPYDDDEHIYDDGNTLQRMFAPEPPSVETLPRHHPKKEKWGLFQKSPKVKPAVKPKPSVPEEYDYPDTMELMRAQDSLKPSKKNSLPLPPKAGKGKAKPPAVATKPKPPIQQRMPGGAPMLSELENHLKKINRTPAKPAPEVPRPIPEVNRPFPEVPRPIPEVPRPIPEPARPPFRNLASQPAGPRPLQPQRKGFKAPEPEQPPQNWPQGNVPRTFMPPRFGLPAAAKSPPVSRVQPIAKIPPMVQSPPLKMKTSKNAPPMPPSPVAKLPPIPVQDEMYEEVNADVSSDEEWTYEPLPQYNIYNV